jgi:hypothetical protein
VELNAGVVDLTSHVSGRYGYLLKFKFEEENSVLKSLEITTWTQLHPASLPSLRQGKNEMQYVTGDHYGLNTRVVEIRTNGSDKDDFLKYCVQPPADFDPKRTTKRAIGPFIAVISAPPDAKIVWFSAGGNFCTHQLGGGPKTRNTMRWFTDSRKDLPKDLPKFTEFYKAEVPADQAHWHYNADVEVKLEQPAKVVFIEYVGDPGVNNLRIFAHCLDDTPPPSAPVSITHTWTENGAPKSKTVRLEKPGAYTIDVEGEPSDESIEMSIESSVK